MLSITFPRRCCRNSKVCYFNMAEKIKFQFKGSVAVNILLEERIMWGSSDEPNNSPRPFGLEMPVWAFFWIKIAILVSNGENIFAEICLQFRKSNWFCFFGFQMPISISNKKRREGNFEPERILKFLFSSSASELSVPVLLTWGTIGAEFNSYSWL